MVIEDDFLAALCSSASHEPPCLGAKNYQNDKDYINWLHKSVRSFHAPTIWGMQYLVFFVLLVLFSYEKSSTVTAVENVVVPIWYFRLV